LRVLARRRIRSGQENFIRIKKSISERFSRGEELSKNPFSIVDWERRGTYNINGRAKETTRDCDRSLNIKDIKNRQLEDLRQAVKKSAGQPNPT
jgi:hypothetical protein